MPRRSRWQSEKTPHRDPRIERLAAVLIREMDTQHIPLRDGAWLLPDISARIEQEIADRKTRHLAEIDECRRAWTEQHGFIDAASLAVRLGLDERELVTAERLGLVVQLEWPPALRKPDDYGPRYWSGRYSTDMTLSAEQRRQIAQTVLLSRLEAAERLSITPAQFDRLRLQAGLTPNIAGLFRLADIDAMREQATALPPPTPNGKTQPIDRWNALNERQQRYLKAIYEIDQAQEAYERSRFVRGERSQPAAEWRQIEYGLLPGLPPFPSQLYEEIEKLGLRDEGTGSTFNALEARKLIGCSYPGQKTPLSVVITALGRRVVRAGISEQPPLRASKDLLTDWAWKHLARLYQAHELGIGAYGFGDRTLAYLDKRDLIIRQDGVVSLSDAGRQHYETNWSLYRELYPHIDAPQPNVSAKRRDE